VQSAIVLSPDAMPAKDTYHDAVKTALLKDGWTITHDPLTLEIGQRQVYVDLGAERLIAAQKGTQEIAVEVKTFAGASTIKEFHLAIGQLLNYRSILRRQQPDRILYLAVSVEVYNSFFKEDLPQISIEDYQIKLLVFSLDVLEVVEWTS
jgi:XisH protein